MEILNLLNQYEVTKRSSGYSEETVKRVCRTVKVYCRETGVTRLSEMTTDSILNWANEKRERGISQSTIYADFNSIRSFLRFLESSKIEFPANRSLIYCKPNYSRLVCLRPEQVRKIISHAPYEIGVLIRLLYTAGLRLSEGITVATEDLRDDNTIYINGKWCKSRTVFITSELKKELEWLAPDGGYCFRDNQNPDEPMNRGMAYFFIKRAMKAAGYPEAYPHSLRHGFATTLIREGANISQVQRLLGHTHISTTQRYEHLVTEDLAAAHTKFLVRV